MTWLVVPKFTPAAAHLADGHYSRRTIGSPQFMPPGQAHEVEERLRALLGGVGR